MNAINGGQANFERKTEFLNKEISFLLDNLRRVIFIKFLIFNRKRQTMDLMKILYCRYLIKETNRYVSYCCIDII